MAKTKGVKGRKFPRNVAVYRGGKAMLGMWYKDSIQGTLGAVRKALLWGTGRRYNPKGVVFEVVSRRSGKVLSVVHWAAGVLTIEACGMPATRLKRPRMDVKARKLANHLALTEAFINSSPRVH